VVASIVGMASGVDMQDVQYLSSSQGDERTKALVQKSSDVVLATHVEPRDDMLEERRRASFDASSLAAYLNGGKEKLQRLCVLKWQLQAIIHASHGLMLHLACSDGAGAIPRGVLVQGGASRASACTELGQQEQALLLWTRGDI
jgi:hypothetical protein